MGREYLKHKKGVIIFYRDMFNSKAFLELSKKPHHVFVLLAALNQVYYQGKTKIIKVEVSFRMEA